MPSPNAVRPTAGEVTVVIVGVALAVEVAVLVDLVTTVEVDGVARTVEAAEEAITKE